MFDQEPFLKYIKVTFSPKLVRLYLFLYPCFKYITVELTDSLSDMNSLLFLFLIYPMLFCMVSWLFDNNRFRTDFLGRLKYHGAFSTSQPGEVSE